MIFRDSGPVLLRHPIFFLIFRTDGGGGGGPAVLPLDPRMIRGLCEIQVLPKHAIHLRCCVRSKTLNIINFMVTVKAALHECVNATGLL